ncbi:hypothetical protein QC762_600168 [Podospora pseudocomata]|uniref:Uncharacterized protein n=1 Tax=Podospora pseudocomata TaxID=2093779 RepID=A0ABR0G884_9PEZI|nr:hypothetical protein QC762_600168 [Podospora pseudocomata]
MATMRLNNSLDLAARLWLMFGFGMEREGGFAWDGDKTLYEAVMAIISPLTPQDRYFIKLGNAHSLDNPQQDPSIAIKRMAKYLGILEKPSSESQPGQPNARVFADTFSPQHMMRLTSFHIFRKKTSHQATFFITQLAETNVAIRTGGQHPYRELAEETLKTLGLLMPVENLDTASWFDEQRDGGGVSRQVDSFRIWQARLLTLEDTYNRASPQTILGFWRDRRNLREWWTFWIALLGLVLVLIGFLVATGSLAVGIVSVLEAKEANRYVSIESVENEKAASSESSAGCCCLATTLDTSVSFDVLGTSDEGLAVVQPTDISNLLRRAWPTKQLAQHPLQ